MTALPRVPESAIQLRDAVENIGRQAPHYHHPLTRKVLIRTMRQAQADLGAVIEELEES